MIPIRDRMQADGRRFDLDPLGLRQDVSHLIRLDPALEAQTEVSQVAVETPGEGSCDRQRQIRKDHRGILLDLVVLNRNGVEGEDVTMDPVIDMSTLNPLCRLPGEKFDPLTTVD